MLSSLNSLVTRATDNTTAFSRGGEKISYAALHNRVAHLADHFAAHNYRRIGLIASNSIDWVVIDLACAAAGCLFVPIPTFFTPSQIAHVVDDAELAILLYDQAHAALIAPLAQDKMLISELPAHTDPVVLTAHEGGARVIYTSGTTGHPKGVCLGESQMNFTMHALCEAIQATRDDVYLSILPLALLLEELCAIHIPLLAGGTSIIDPETAQKMAAGNVESLQQSIVQNQPSVTVLVPDLLRGWLGSLVLQNIVAPPCLRYVAVGGAKISADIISQSWERQIPVHEGYGLSECGSVVALNRPGENCPGSVGRVLNGLEVEIIDGEICVTGPNVMQGYLNHAAPSHPLHTGDIGHFDSAGRLIVEGRKDSVLVTGAGRNVSPEWIEALLTSDFRIARAILGMTAEGSLAVIIVPTVLGADLIGTRDLVVVTEICRHAPKYAQPQHCFWISAAQAAAADLFTASGRPRRHAFNEVLTTLSDEKENKHVSFF